MANATPLLVNDSYALDYFSLDGVTQIKAPDQLWWASKQRYAAVNPDDHTKYLAIDKGGNRTSEYLEIDLGQVQPMNFISMNILKAPTKITIEYDAISAVDAISGEGDLEDNHAWVHVKPQPGAPFDNHILYQAQHKNPWHTAEFYFTDPKGNMVVTQFLRIRFARQDVDWPVKNAKPFRWPIMVRNFRSTRYIAKAGDTIGGLFLSPPSSLMYAPDPLSATSTHELRQQFAMPADAARGNIDPNIMGFGVFVKILQDPASSPSDPLDAFSMQWSVWDVTNSPKRLKSGIETKALAYPMCWIDVYFDPFNPIATDRNNPRIYELRVSSLNTAVCESFGYGPARTIPGLPLAGTFGFTTGSTVVTVDVDLTAKLAVGEYIEKVTRNDGAWRIAGGPTWDGAHGTITLAQPFVGITESVGAIRALPVTTFSVDLSTNVVDFANAMVMRLWGDIADSGTDVLGNSYRGAVQYESAQNAIRATQVGWQSAPQPSPDAVESLYFDLRTLKDGKPLSTMVDAVRIGPRTPGVQMHIYYTEASLNSMSGTALRPPQTLNEWDQLLWKPIHVTYTLRNHQIYELPQPIRAAYVKLEFTALRPQPFKVPKNPSLPPVRFKRYPTWIETLFSDSRARRAIEDWFVAHETKVEVKVLKTMTDPIQEFQYKERELLASIALGKTRRNTASAEIVNLAQKVLIDPVTGSKIQINTKDMYKSTLWVNVDADSVLGQAVASRVSGNTSSDPVEGYLSNLPQVSVSSTPNNRISESYAYIASTPLWFNRVCRHIYKIDTAEFRTQAYYVGISSVEFLRKDYTVFRDDTLIQDNLTDLDQLEENTFLPDTPSQIANAIFGNNPQTGVVQNSVVAYVNYTVSGVPYTDEQITFLETSTMIPLQGIGDVAQNVTLTSSPGGQGTVYQYGVDYDITYTTDPILGKTVNNIGVANFSNRFVVSRGTTHTDINTILGIAKISAVDVYAVGSHGGVAPDSATVTGRAVPSAAQAYGRAESITATAVAQPSAAEIYTTIQISESGTVTGVFPTNTAGNLAINAEVMGFSDSQLSLPQLTGIGLHEGAPLSDALTTADKFTLYPDVELFSLWVRWSTIQPTSRTDFTWPASLDASIDDAEAKGYKIVLRIACGGDTPAWVYTDPTNPVTSVNLIANDLTTGQITMPLPWDPDLLILYRNLLTLLQPKLDPVNSSGLTANGNRRSDNIYFIPTSMAMADSRDCGMSLTYGSAATYTGSATLATPITGTSTSITATGANGGAYPTSPFLAKIDNELIYVSRAGGSDTLTVQSSGRGWSGSVATSHSTGATVQYASAVPWTGTFNGFTGPYDLAVQNQAQWLAIDTATNNTANLLTAWRNAVDANVGLVTQFSGIPTVISYGPNFSDNWANALLLAQDKTLQYPAQLWHMTGDLQPGNDGSNNPTKNGHATYYEGYSTAAGQVIREVIAYGGLLGFQAAPSATFSIFTNPYSGGSSAFRDVVTDSVSAFSPTFLMVDEVELVSG